MKKRISLMLACLLALSLVFAVSADKDGAALADAVSLPAALVKGHSYSLPTALGTEAVTYTVNGQPCDGVFTADGEQVEIAYSADGDAIGTYTLNVVDTKDSADHCAYFYGDIAVTENQNDITLSGSKDSQTSFINKLVSDNLGINLQFAETNAYEALVIKLTDAADGRNSLTIRMDLAAGTFEAGGQKITVEFDEAMQLRYKNLNQKLYDGDTELVACEKNDNGDDFAGFQDGVYLTIGFEGVTGSSSVAITRLGNQPMGHKNASDADLTEPVIVLTSDLMTNQNMGEEFVIPAFAAYDVFSAIKETGVSVELPDGTTATESFTIAQYGRYKITYTAKDSCSNTVKVNKMVYVNDDIAPELSVKALDKTEYKLGDTVTLPGYTVSDNLDVYTVDAILVLPNCERRLLTSDTNGEVTYCLNDSSLYSATFRNDNSSFRTEQTGTYTLRYVAYDDQFNKTVQELTFTVE